MKESMSPYKYDVVGHVSSVALAVHRSVEDESPTPVRLSTNNRVGPDANLEILMRQVDAKDKHFWG